ncbi:hypothetical protein CEXT_190801 [Caerostris extrusa]|uniref:Uncharacterized protein n=1 Tax=Caerostris extrusa TaxID=172846 RepID=A0AAV4VUK7_CAEEX|nr:hypothetical protein CEXT_190801 [Caerostris extrusa]
MLRDRETLVSCHHFTYVASKDEGRQLESSAEAQAAEICQNTQFPSLTFTIQKNASISIKTIEKLRSTSTDTTIVLGHFKSPTRGSPHYSKKFTDRGHAE